jgi:hypothetical protein
VLFCLLQQLLQNLQPLLLLQQQLLLWLQWPLSQLLEG